MILSPMPETKDMKHLSAGELAPPNGLVAERVGSTEAAIADTRAERVRALVSWGVPLALILYLAFRGGGYDAEVRLEVGLAVWVLVLVGSLAGVVPRPGLNRAAWILIGVLAAFTAWTALSTTWSESAERSVTEAARVALYLGVFLLLTSIPGRDRTARLVGGVAAAIGVVAVFAVLSRLHPAWFGPNVLAESQPLSRARLAYPLDAWNGLATFISMGFPLLLAVSIEARHTATRMLAAAALPLLGLTAYLTYSRGGALATAAGLVVFVAIYRRRAAALALAAIAAVGAALLIVATDHRDALANGLDTGEAHQQGTEVLVLLLIVCAAVALGRLGLQRAMNRGLVPRFDPARKTIIGFGAAAAALAVAICLAVGVPGKLANTYEEFKQPSIGEQGSAQRFSSASGNGRYQYWQSAIDAGESAPIAGIGAGGYEFWWARHATIPGYVRDAHSLYFETFGELGAVGLLLLGGFVVGILVVGVRSARRAEPRPAAMIAAATGGAAAFSVALFFDWGWEIAVIPITYLVLGSAIVGGPRDGAAAIPTRGRGRGLRLAAAAVAVVTLVVLASTYVGVSKVRSSQSEFLAGDLDQALADARTAEDFQPYAATPLLQEALLLEQRGEVEEGVALATDAATKEPTNWRIWLTLSRLQVANGEPRESVESYERARSLNPRSTLIPTADPRDTHPGQF
jgi:hypothetical protein